MKKNTCNQIQALRICLCMAGFGVTDVGCDLILTVQSEMKRLGGKYSLKDAAKVEAHILKKYKKKKEDEKPTQP